MATWKGPLAVVASFAACFAVEQCTSLKPTTHFADKSEYLPIITSNIFADIVVIIATFLHLLGKTLPEWYKKYRLSAMMADILIGVLYLLLARYLVFGWKQPVGLTLFAAVAVAIQVVFDFAFYAFFSAVPTGANHMLDFFKYYASRVKLDAVFSDSVLVVLAVVVSAMLNAQSFDVNVVSLIFVLYLVPFVIYMKD
jgi:hypothetical protein